ncbi:MAG: DUF1934 domain-containing protein [Clostridia bacterium]|nr:DUF1934 domain-containing protein [Clostridia bacterium]
MSTPKEVKITELTGIVRYEGTFSSLAAFFLSPEGKRVDEEHLCRRGKGTLYEKETGFAVRYTADSQPTVLSCEKELFSMEHNGNLLRFREKKEQSFRFRTAFGEMDAAIYTLSTSLKEKSGSMLFTAEYYLLLSGMVQKNVTSVKIDKEKTLC